MILTSIVEPLIKSQNTSSRHTRGRLRTSGACQNPVKTIAYWIPDSRCSASGMTKIG